MSRLTAEDVANQQFTSRGLPWLGERFVGYDETEVDLVLDIVEADYADHQRLVSEIRGKCEAVLAQARSTFEERELARQFLTLTATDIDLTPLPSDELVSP